MTEVETELDSRYDDIDVESILARCQKGPITFSKRCLYQAPEFIKRLPSTEEVEEGTTVSFGCKVVGYPNPTVTWFKDDDVIKAGARAIVDAEESGIHSIKIADISKCDAGIYKIRASNLEARSKLRNRKKAKRARLVTCPPLFPAIIERVAEEQIETQEAEDQAESPLTPIYCTISRKDPVMWPAFLGDWAYNSDDILHRDEIDDTEEIEDVFDDDDDILTPTPTSLTFVSSAYAQMVNNDEKLDDVIVKGDDVTIKGDNHISDKDSEKCETNTNQNSAAVDKNSKSNFDEKGSKDSEEIEKGPKTMDIQNTDKNLSNEHTSRKEVFCDKINNNNKDFQHNKNNGVNINGVGVKSANDDLPESEQACNHQTEVKQRFIDPETVSVISVHRSYAKGDSTSSVARRSPSPLSRSRNPVTFNKNGRHCDMYSNKDMPTLQNMNNERILMKMNRKVPFSSRCFSYFRSLASTSSWEDHLIELFVLLCCGTFLALWFELPPKTFVIDILIAMFIKFVLTEVLNDS